MFALFMEFIVNQKAIHSTLPKSYHHSLSYISPNLAWSTFLTSEYFSSLNCMHSWLRNSGLNNAEWRRHNRRYLGALRRLPKRSRLRLVHSFLGGLYHEVHLRLDIVLKNSHRTQVKPKMLCGRDFCRPKLIFLLLYLWHQWTNVQCWTLDSFQSGVPSLATITVATFCKDMEFWFILCEEVEIYNLPLKWK